MSRVQAATQGKLWWQANFEHGSLAEAVGQGAARAAAAIVPDRPRFGRAESGSSAHVKGRFAQEKAARAPRTPEGLKKNPKNYS